MSLQHPFCDDTKMTLKRKMVILGFTLALLLGFIGLNILAYNHARAMTTYTEAGRRTSQPEKLSLRQRISVLLTGVTIIRPASNKPPQSLVENSEVLTIPVDNRITLEAWYANQGTNTPLVIMFHGYAEDKTSIIDEARALLDMQLSVLLVDFRGSGGSSESYTTVGYWEADDVNAAYLHAKEHFDHLHLFLFGQSKGAVALLRAIQQHKLNPDAVIIEAVFDTMLNTVRNRFRAMRTPSFPNAELLVFWGGQQRGFNAFRHNPLTYAKSLTMPALFMHGEKDPRATLREGNRVFQAVPGPKQFITFPKSRHESYVGSHPDQWRQSIQAFLSETIPSGPRYDAHSEH